VGVVLVLLVGRPLHRGQDGQPRKIPGVSYTSTPRVSRWSNSTSPTSTARDHQALARRHDRQAAEAQQEGESRKSQSCAEKPLENDQLFIDTLLSIQESIKNPPPSTPSRR
jgi:hypothetical protein